MADFCSAIDQATKNLKPGSKPEETAALLTALQEVNESHLANSPALKNAHELAKQIQASGKFTDEVDPGIPGAKAVLQQSDGKPTFLELVEGDRTETMRFDPEGDNKPVMNTIHQQCSDKLVSSTFFYTNGTERRISSVSLPPVLEILMDRDGKPEKVKSMF